MIGNSCHKLERKKGVKKEQMREEKGGGGWLQRDEEGIKSEEKEQGSS